MEQQKKPSSWSFRIGQFLDDALSVISPSTAVRRRGWRNSYFGYEAATESRKDGMLPTDGRAEAINKVSRRMLRARARDLERNSDVVAAMLKAFENNVIGTGLTMQAYTDDKHFNDVIEGLFKKWSTTTNCDLGGEFTLNEILTMMVRRYVVDGGILCQYSLDQKSTIPLKLQIREVDDFTNESNPLLQSGNLISEGVELTKHGVPVAYWLTSVDANGMELMAPQRIPREDVDFIWKKTRPSQYREISLLTTTVVRVRDLEDYMSAVAFAQKTAACTSAYVETDNLASTPGRQINTTNGTRLENIEGGTVKYLRPGEKLKTLIPAGQAAEVENYIVTNQRMAAAALGMSLESATRNVERVNYSSARQNLIFDQKTFEVMRELFITHFLKPMYRRFVDACYYAGLLETTKFVPGKEEFYEVEFLASGLPWIDPLKEANADNVKLANGGLSFQSYCSAQGADWRDRLDDMKEVKEYADNLGLTLPFFVPLPQQEEESEVKGEDGTPRKQNPQKSL